MNFIFLILVLLFPSLAFAQQATPFGDGAEVTGVITVIAYFVLVGKFIYPVYKHI